MTVFTITNVAVDLVQQESVAWVRLRVENEKGEELDLAIRADNFNLVLDRLLAKGLELSPGVPVRPALGETYTLAGYGVGKRPDGGIKLSISIDLESGGRTFDIAATPKEAADLADLLLAQASPTLPIWDPPKKA